MSAHVARVAERGSGPQVEQCPNCQDPRLFPFYSVRSVPVHSVLLMPNREYARDFPRGDVALAFCEGCGFVTNTSFDPSVHSYSERYEETQGFSPTFQGFHTRLAQSLIDKYDIRGKRVIEIGCGKGEFLSLMCELGGNTGVGFDPAFVPERNPVREASRVTFVQDFYSEAYAHFEADVICCKMTLEHIQDTQRFVQTVRRSIGDRTGTLVFFQVPDFTRILRDYAFWDIYYEHCSYFTGYSLQYLFEQCGFEVVDLGTEYDEQYLQIVARPSNHKTPDDKSDSTAVSWAKAAMDRFGDQTLKRIEIWSDMLADAVHLRQKWVLWGSGSKAVAFLSAMRNPEAIEYVVDINPYRQGYYMPGTGQKIVSPEFLKEYKADVVIAMNSIYCAEIQRSLNQMDSNARLLAV